MMSNTWKYIESGYDESVGFVKTDVEINGKVVLRGGSPKVAKRYIYDRIKNGDTYIESCEGVGEYYKTKWNDKDRRSTADFYGWES